MPVDDDTTIYVEVADDIGGPQKVGRVGDIVRDAAENLQDAVARIRPAAMAVLNGVREMAVPPDSVSVEFGIKLTAEAGVVIARAASEANFSVTVSWSTRSTSSGHS
ncbi:CU044_2847 family protein [Nocardia sp. CA-135953]|uniref:CU044_2847 family protein n=1 Tax=Nocardia sp. CA-135953 TaxID=3239978 RepID=UPI003D95119B